MKKLFSILIILCYGLSASGASLQLHYCCGKLKSVNLSYTQPKACCEMSGQSDDCCESKTVAAKDQQHHDEVFSIQPGNGSPIEAAVPVNVPFISPAGNAAAKPFIFYPRVVSNRSLYLVHCVFRI